MQDNTQDNALIAEFMGFTVISDNARAIGAPEANFIKHKQIKYHKSWDWLMYVVEKINSSHTDCFVIIYTDKCTIHNMYPNNMKTIEYEGATMIEAVYSAVVAFIKWYNEQNNG